MILAIFTWTAYVAACAIVTVILGGGAYLAYRVWRDHQRDIGHGYGSIDGHKAAEARGYVRGYSRACLDLAQPDEAQHYAGIISAIDAQHYADAVRMETVRRSVQGKESQS